MIASLTRGVKVRCRQTMLTQEKLAAQQSFALLERFKKVM
jgi:hypothetical protein